MKPPVTKHPSAEINGVRELDRPVTSSFIAAGLRAATTEGDSMRRIFLEGMAAAPATAIAVGMAVPVGAPRQRCCREVKGR